LSKELKNDTDAVYLVSRKDVDGAIVLKLVTGDKLKETKTALAEVFSAHVHAIQPRGGDPDVCSMALFNAEFEQVDAMYSQPDYLSPNPLRDNRDAAIESENAERVSDGRFQVFPVLSLPLSPEKPPRSTPAVAKKRNLSSSSSSYEPAQTSSSSSSSSKQRHAARLTRPRPAAKKMKSAAPVPHNKSLFNFFSE
jgi:hypothetical protein